MRTINTVRAMMPVVLLAFLAACSGRASEEGPSESEAGGNDGAVSAQILDFSAPALGGGAIEGSDYAGKDLAMWFWAPWCPTCNEEAPGVTQLVQRNSQIEFLGMAGRDGQDAMQEFVDKYGLQDMPQAVSEDGSLWGRFGVPAQPAWIFVNDDGTYETFLGALTEDQAQEQIDSLAER